MCRICQSLLCLLLITGCASVRKTPSFLVSSEQPASGADPAVVASNAGDAVVRRDHSKTADDFSTEADLQRADLRESTQQPSFAVNDSIDSASDSESSATSEKPNKHFVRTVSLQASEFQVDGDRQDDVQKTDAEGDGVQKDDRQDASPADAGSSNQARAEDMKSAAPRDAANADSQSVQFDEVLNSVYQSYPLLQSALYARNIALGQQIGAAGAFDTKLKGASENGPQGFYQTYRQSIGVIQPTYWGGEFFAGYRIGRGDFQPWYLERQTNDGGEFKAGVLVPLARNREIDARRAELWKAGYERSMAEPDIQAQLIAYVQEASYGYWDWVAAGETHRIAKRILFLAEDRTNRIEAQVKAGLVDPPELTDNLRLVAIRLAKTADTRRKLEQTASKLSVYYRDGLGNPLVASEDQLPGFPEPEPVDDAALSADIQRAVSQRPELRLLDLLRQQTQIDLAEARNQLQPELNAVVMGSQDVGEPTSSKRDKSPYESEASLYLDVPVQRRKARGKITELQGKLAQLAAKRRIVADKISVDVQMAHAALKSAWEQVEQTREALKHAEDLAVRERTNQEAGASDLLKVALREQYAVESAEKNVEALKLYFESRADYRAALAQDQIDR